MAILGFTGTLPVAIGLTWKGDIVPNAMSSSFAGERYLVANESVTDLKVTALLGGVARVLERKATAKRRLYDDKLNLFVSEPVSSSLVEDFLALPKGAKLFLELGFTFNSFFDVLLEQMTRVDADLHNLANPNDSKAILGTFQHSDAGGNVSITYNSATQAAKALEGTLVDTEVKPPPAGSKIPAVKIMVEVDFGATPTAVQKELMRKLVAMDWSKLARFGRPDSPRKDVQIWKKNVILYLVNHTDMDRGERFRQAVIGRHKGKSPLQLSNDLRDDLDLHLVTANHWGQAREDMKTERHQRLLSDLFGTLHQKSWLSSPVFMARTLSDDFLANDTDKTAALALQYGTGHCGEHATCSFSVLRSIMLLPGNQVKAAIFSGNANIDHAFVVYNLTLDRTVLTKAASAANTRVSVGETIAVFNLKDAIAKNAPRIGFVMDPYLDKTVMKPTAVELLAALNSDKRKKAGKDTDFLAFSGIHPLPAPPVDDFTGKTAAERKALVKNV
jgi:hypothetical protein